MCWQHRSKYMKVSSVFSLLHAVLGISNPLPVNNTQDRYKLLLDVNSSNAIYCSPGSHQDSEMLRKRGKKRKDKNKQKWHAGKKLTPKTTFSVTALHWFPSVITATRATLAHLVKPHLHDCSQATDSHWVFLGPLVFPVLVLPLRSSLLLPKGDSCCASYQGISSKRKRGTCDHTTHRLSQLFSQFQPGFEKVRVSKMYTFQPV